MEDYLARFITLASFLDQHPKIELLNFETFPPATDDEIAEVEKKLGAPLGENVRSFFLQTNGIQMLWVHKDNEDFDPDSFVKFSGPLNQSQHKDSYQYSDGCINIQSLGDIFLQSDWEDIIWRQSQKDRTVSFKGATWNELELMKGIYPFDIYSESSCMAFLAPMGSGTQSVLMAKDYYIEIDGSRITDFNSYLEFLLASKGAVAFRSKVYSKPQGHRIEPLITLVDFWNSGNSYSGDEPPEW